jgi:16S rRNA C967 or C1407 C5-methylase (RsmB/RsmF family)/NOL1/NOP2/fmu family ribosome biogenesis protein
LADHSAKGFFIVKRIPETLLGSLEGVQGFNRETFERVHLQGEQITSIRINPLKKLFGEGPLQLAGEAVPWSRYGCYLSKRPSFTFDPFFHAGCYYVQEASSMFLEQALMQLADLSKSLKVLDLCGAPGGKSTHIQSLISPESLLVANEVIRSRSHVLSDNIIKWGTSNVMVTNNDPKVFENLEEYFDIMVVDAPCSGSGLFRRDEDAIDEWSLNNVQLCSRRQQRILADVLPCLKSGGLLIYSTCSYSAEEDEAIADWLLDNFEMKNLPLKIDSDWNIVESVSPLHAARSYRFYPDKLKGEGFFLSCFRKLGETKELKRKVGKPETASSKEKMIIAPWLQEKRGEVLKDEHGFLVLPQEMVTQYSILHSVLDVRYAGTRIGAIMKERLVPEHALALGNILSPEIAANELNFDEAIRYLQRQEINFNSSGKGWQLVRYEGRNLGWINVLPNRVNNYYPKELRILKQTNDSGFEKL